MFIKKLNKFSQKQIERHSTWYKFLNEIKLHKYILGSIILIGLLIVFISYSFAVSVPVASIQIKSENLNYDNSEQGSWLILKSAVWTGKNKARITFNVNTVEKNSNKDRDIILMIDNSSSMGNNGLATIKSNISRVLNELKKDSNTNRVALISFNTVASVLSDFTDDLDSIDSLVDDIVSIGMTNYYRAFLKLDSLLENYNYDNDKSVLVVFITDSYSNLETPNEVAEYNYLKTEYPYLNVRAIQYNVVLDDIDSISDKSYIANSSNIKAVLHRAMFGVVTYDSFIIEDNVSSYFNIDSVSSSLGDVDINNNKVTLDISEDVFDSGTSVKLNIDISLKDEYMDIEGLYETNSSEVITSSIDEIDEDVTSSNSPILVNNYTVTYDGNAPSTCNVTNVPRAKKEIIFNTVSISSSVPVCFGYQFKGWEIVNENVEILNDDHFIMPEENVTIRAVWSKIYLYKSLEGEISEAATLYNIFKYIATFSDYATEYTGNHQDSILGTGSKKIYHFYADTEETASDILNANNVIFAGFCWQMIRTTDTGGVKMIYNGVPDSDNQCGTDRDESVGYSDASIQTLSKDYYYGTSYEYDSSSKTFSLSGTITNGTWSDSTYQDLLGKYTCLSSSSSGTCSTLYYVERYYTDQKANTLVIDDDSHYSQIGTQYYDDNIYHFGYMYNTLYDTDSFGHSSSLYYTVSLSTSYYYANSVIYSSITGKYTLVNPTKVSSLADAKGKYTFRSAIKSYNTSSVYYIVAVDVDDSKGYYIKLSDGNYLSYYNDTYTYGDSYTDNGDGTYTIVNPTTINTTDYYDNYLELADKYVCLNATDNMCSDVWYFSKTSERSYYVTKISNEYLYSNSFTYENGKYKLDEETSVFLWDYGREETNTKMNNAHYTCLNTTGECESLSYVYSVSSGVIYYITLDDGKSVYDALNEMFFSDSVNTTNSTIKNAVDAWYERYMTDYTDYLEDVIFCNDRSIMDYGGWNPSGGNVLDILRFNGYSLTEFTDLSCPNETDRFSVNNNKAKLKYPVGIATSAEMNLLGSYIRTTGYDYWLMTPSFYWMPIIQYLVKVTSSGELSLEGTLLTSNGIRPVISLKPGTEYVSGYGTASSPYIVYVDN